MERSTSIIFSAHSLSPLLILNDWEKAAMGIRERAGQQFRLLLSQRSDTTTLQQQKFAYKFVTSNIVSTMQQCIINNISKNKH